MMSINSSTRFLQSLRTRNSCKCLVRVFFPSTFSHQALICKYVHHKIIWLMIIYIQPHVNMLYIFVSTLTVYFYDITIRWILLCIHYNLSLKTGLTCFNIKMIYYKYTKKNNKSGMSFSEYFDFITFVYTGNNS